MTERDDVQELDRLRRRVSELEHAQTATSSRGRTLGALALFLVGTLLFPIGLVGIWAYRTVEDTDRYVSTVAPLIRDPQVQELLADRITEGLLAQVDVEGILKEVLPPRAQPLAAPIQSGLEGFVRSQTEEILATRETQELWDRLNAELQRRIIAALKGETDEGVTVQGDRIVLDTGVIIEEVRAALVARGFTIVENVPIPSVADREVVLLQSAQVQQVSTIYRLSSFAGQWLVWVALGLLAASVVVGQRKSRWIALVGWSIALGSLLVAIALAAGKEAALVSIGAAAVSAQASVLEAITRYLAGTARAGIAFGITLIAVGWLMGRSKSAWVVRGAIGDAEQSIADRIRRVWPGVTGIGDWVARAAVGIRVAIAALALFSIFGRADISAGRVTWTFVLALVAWLVVDVLARTASTNAGGDAEPDDEHGVDGSAPAGPSETLTATPTG